MASAYVRRAPPSFPSLAEFEEPARTAFFSMKFWDLRGVAPVREMNGRELPPKEPKRERRVDLRNGYANPFAGMGGMPRRGPAPAAERGYEAKVHEPNDVSKVEALRALLAAQRKGTPEYERIAKQLRKAVMEGLGF